MKDVTKKNFRNLCIFLFFALAMFLVLMILFIGTGNFIYLIPWTFFGLAIIIIFCIYFKSYLNYKHNTNILEGIITHVSTFKSYCITIKSDDKTYIARYVFISSHICNQVGSKCTFVVNKKGKAYIKDIE
ncbi:MAG: hypothetical protein K2I88_02830 [Anaeroplasmataceae bacterium]|nr:hypothetical protein [Anaeroplasmataceae bacterium]